MSAGRSIQTGQRGAWQWAATTEIVDGFEQIIARRFANARLCVTSFDSGPFRPTGEEFSAEWSICGEFAWSPLLTPRVELPTGGFDEWYVFADPPRPLSLNETFVNYVGFHLSLEERREPLIAVQERFWNMLDRLDPIAYFCSGFLDIAVSKDREFVADFEKAARRGGCWRDAD